MDIHDGDNRRFRPQRGSMTAEERLVIFGSSLGTVFEWYDFYIYGTLAPILAAQFFAGVNSSAAFIFTLLAFAAGFIRRHDRVGQPTQPRSP
jgi:hypothetical protein